MTALTSKKPKNTYKDLLQVSNSNAGIDGTRRAIEDGEGTASKLLLSSAAQEMTGPLYMTGASIFQAEGAAVASAAAPNIWATDGDTIHITGTTNITSFAAAPQVGAWKKLIFDGAVLLTHGANLNLNNGGSNYTTATDDVVFVYADTTTQFDLFIMPVSGKSVSRVADFTSGTIIGITDLAVADGGTGASTAAAAATALGVGTGDSPQFTAVNIGHATDTTVTRASAGDIAVEGNTIYRAGGTDVAIADGGTGASTLAAAGIAQLSVAQNWTAAQRGGISALTDGVTITPDFALANNFSVTLAGNRTLANPSNLTAGQSGAIVITQDATGSRTLAYGTQWKFAGGTAPVLTTTASAVDVLAYYVESTSRIFATLTKDVK